MIDPGSLYITTQVEPDDAASGFSCGKHPLATAKSAFAEP